ncbi:PqqD family peptide modification chaperone [Halomonas korlensis]|nr:PqqD family peptide modification chaperone [Halomonas korlensis]
MNRSTLVKRHPSLLSSSVDDDLVLFSAEQGMYYGTQAVGRRIWTLIEDEVSVAEVCDKLLDEFSVDRVTCEREVLQFVEQLANEGMVTVR